MAKELEKRGNKVGSSLYFVQLHRRGLLRRIMQPEGSVNYERQLKEAASKIIYAAKTVYGDLSAAGPVIRFIETGNLRRLEAAIAQLNKLCAIAHQHLDCYGECMDYLTLRHRSTQPYSRASLRDLERGYGILRGSGSYDLPESREKVFEMLLRGFMPDAADGEPDLARFVSDLEAGNGREALRDLELYIKYRDNPRNYYGSWGEPIGSERYLSRLEETVFGGRLSPGDLPEGDYSYGDSLEAQLGEIGEILVDDIRQSPYDEYIVYDNRSRMIEAAEGLEKFTSRISASAVKQNATRYRRLEDFDNKVIEFDTRGTTRARMAWENGKNVMYIEADVCFVKGLFIDKQTSSSQHDEFERRIQHAKGNFELWSGDYTVFSEQQLKVEVAINRVDSSSNAATVTIMDIPGLRSFAWGGTFPNIFDWNPEKGKAMGLFGDKTQSATPQHEFGHWLGLQDAYQHDNIEWKPAVEVFEEIVSRFWSLYGSRYITKSIFMQVLERGFKVSETEGPFPLYGVPDGVYPDYDDHTIMNITGAHSITKQNPRATNNDIEMVVLAFQTGRRQNYQIQFPWEEISIAMGRGN